MWEYPTGSEEDDAFSDIATQGTETDLEELDKQRDTIDDGYRRWGFGCVQFAED